MAVDREEGSLLWDDPHFLAFIPTGISVTVLICILQWEMSLFREEMFLEQCSTDGETSQLICLPSVRVKLTEGLIDACVCASAEFVYVLNSYWCRGTKWTCFFFLFLLSASCNDASLGCAGQHKLFGKRMQFMLPGFVNKLCLFAPSWSLVLCT